MKQRVNISYSIDLEELPQQIEYLLEKAEKKLSETCDEFKTLIETNNSRMTMSNLQIEKISQLREKLMDVDFILNDVNVIVGGYVGYKIQNQCKQKCNKYQKIQKTNAKKQMLIKYKTNAK